jgi:hypothetical protein
MKEFKVDKKTTVYAALLTFYTVAFLWINIIATKLVQITPNIGINASALLLIYPLLYIISDFVQEIYGYKASRFNAISAIVFSLLMLGFLKLTALAPSMSDPANVGLLFEVISGTVIVGFTGTYVGDWINDIMFEKMRKDSIPFWTRAVVSSIPGQLVDAGIFYGIMSSFYWHMPVEKLMFSIFVGTLIKLSWETVCVPISSKLVTMAKKEFSK